MVAVMDGISNIIGQRLRTFREQKGWSQYDLAEESGVMRQTINLIENNKVKKIDYINIVALAKALGVTPNDLTGEEKPGPLSEQIERLEAIERQGVEFLKQLHEVIVKLKRI